MKWQKIAAFLLVIALLLPLLVMVATPLSADENYSAFGSRESKVGLFEEGSVRTIDEMPAYSVAVNWGSRVPLKTV